MSYDVRFSKQIQRQIGRLPGNVRSLARRRILDLRTQPRQPRRQRQQRAPARDMTQVQGGPSIVGQTADHHAVMSTVHMQSILCESLHNPTQIQATAQCAPPYNPLAIAPERWPDIELRWTPYVKETALPFLEARPDLYPMVWQSNDTFTKIYQIQTGH